MDTHAHAMTQAATAADPTPTTPSSTTPSDTRDRDAALRALPVMGPALGALHGAAVPLLDAARVALTALPSPERDAAASLLLSALRGLRGTWAGLEVGLSRCDLPGETAAGAALDEWIGALRRLAVAKPEPQAAEDDDADRWRAERDAEETAARDDLPGWARPLADVHDPTALAWAVGSRTHTDPDDPDAGLHGPDHDARARALGELRVAYGVDCAGFPVDLGMGACYALGLPTDLRRTVLAGLGEAERGVNVALAALGAPPDELCDVVARTVALLPAD
jgi:hypothetical protein